MTNDRLLDRAHHDLYISLVQRFRVKSTIQNFDSPDGTFCTRRAGGTEQALCSFFDVIQRKLAYSSFAPWTIVSRMLPTRQTMPMSPTITTGTRISVWRGR